MTLTDPTEATQAKFRQLYKTSSRIPILQSVVELIKLCQIALYMFEKLEHQYIDGLLCDVTEKAISSWWTEVGAEHYNFEPTDGVLGPSTVSALLGMLMGARNRLHWYGAPVSKDVFEVESTKRGVAYFQKQQKLEKTRRLDRQTLFRLHTATAKGAAAEGWGVQKAVKSTVTEIGGKRGELVMDMVSGRDKGGLADIETVDIDKFVSLAYGDRPRWLWHGKTRRSLADPFGSGDQDLSSSSIQAPDTTPKRTHALPLDEELVARRKEDKNAAPYTTHQPAPVDNIADASGDRDTVRRGVFKSVADKMSDARSGFGRIKDAVGGNRRGYASKLSMPAREEFSDGANGSTLLPSDSQNSAMASNPAITRVFTWKNKPEEYLAAIRRGDDVLPGQNDDAQYSGASARDIKPDEKSGDELLIAGDWETNLNRIGSDIRKDISHKGSPTRQSVEDDSDFRGPLPQEEQRLCRKIIPVARRRSCGIADLASRHITNESRWARRMSFGDAEEAILTWEEVIDLDETSDYLTCVEAHAEAASHLNHVIEEIVNDVGPWVEDKIKAVEFLNERYGQDKKELQDLYHRLDETCQRTRHDSDKLLSEERENLTESVKEIEVLVARLEYEINGLSQKVADVEDSIQNFERQVDDVEKRAAELKVTLETESWPHWFVRTLTGIGTGPNITREPQ
ncbi:Sin3 complex subunit [Metarhizium album ARSEF 1941]|uniref:Sin3 complex subunit n=1 Tax=Metarhizium album (strain ARSEF 1941) TaxID=1081103 RepID=A0A0B2X1F1_METAS|nr:Sin3 complex subunit [Metarhizium album ARSEF 1941]KHN98905.1 Sin3 complex subunit [Metarhizium album ARSEF 1941]